MPKVMRNAGGFVLPNPGVHLALALAFVGCGDSDENDFPLVVPARDGGVDAGVVDLGSKDPGPLPELKVLHGAGSCTPCGSNAACPGDAACLRRTSDNAQFCFDSCPNPQGCLSGFDCIEIDGLGPTCIPRNGLCRARTGFGTPCFEDTASCMPGLDACQDDFFGIGYCTQTCEQARDCPADYRCAEGDDGDRVCIANTLSGAETCGRDGEGSGCGTNWDCDFNQGERCVRSSPHLPGVCALPCEGGCAEGTSCLETRHGPRCLPANCTCHAIPPQGARDLMREALQTVELTPCEVVHRVSDRTLILDPIATDPYRLQYFEPIAYEPLLAPDWGKTLIGELEAQAPTSLEEVSNMVEALAKRLDHPVERQAASPISEDEPLVEALASLIASGGQTPDRAALAQDASDLDLNLRRALALVIEGIERAARARDEAASDQAIDTLFRAAPDMVLDRNPPVFDPRQVSIENLVNRDIEYGGIYGGAVDLLQAIEQADLGRFAVESAEEATEAVLLFSQSTPYGRILVGSADSGFYTTDRPELNEPIALLLDLGGNDIYEVEAAGNQTVQNSVSVLIDLGGVDRYQYRVESAPGDEGRLPSDGSGRYIPRGTPDADFGPVSLSIAARQGGARAGIALLWDAGQSNDTYRSLTLSQGSAVFGVGLVIDEGGEDTYEVEAHGQGAASFGIGIVFDVDGNDIYRSYTKSQGYGFSRGAGLLHDRAGDDSYLMNVGDPAFGGDPIYFSGQRPGEANTSLGQGFGFGRRLDEDLVFLSGGLGILLDAEGNDRYEASIFAQGGGFWYGTGILADHEGNDSYDGLWYVMGSGAHYSLGLFLEGEGNDSYGGAFPRINVTIGAAHDYTSSIFIDDAGNDIYFGSRLSLGAGNVSGLGFLVDNAGDDQYSLRRSYGLGGAGNLEDDDEGSARLKVKNLGVFIDAGGRDLYDLEGVPIPGRVDNAVWTSTQSASSAVASSELGVGLDGEGVTGLRAR